MLLTGASSNHFRPLMRLLRSVKEHEPEAQVVAYDLGLSASEVAEAGALAELRPFPFGAYPPHVAVLSNFAWKPLIVRHHLAQEDRVLWLDAGDVLTRPLAALWAEVDRVGLYTPHSVGRVCTRTLRPTLEALGASPEVEQKIFRHGALVGLAARRRPLAEAWAAAALDPAVIAPPGARRGTHHFDQSVLSVLAYQLAAAEGFELSTDRYGVVTNTDDKRFVTFGPDGTVRMVDWEEFVSSQKQPSR